MGSIQKDAADYNQINFITPSSTSVMGSDVNLTCSSDLSGTFMWTHSSGSDLLSDPNIVISSSAMESVLTTAKRTVFIPRSYCNTSRISVLFDGIIPTLTGLDGDMWATQLLTSHTFTSSSITFNFNGIANYVGVGTIEVVMFSCSMRGIGANRY